MFSFAGWKSNSPTQEETKNGHLPREDFFVLFGERVMRTTKKAKKARQAFEDPLFVEPSAWVPPYQAWPERAKSTRELAERATNDNARKLLLIIAEGYDRLGK